LVSRLDANGEICDGTNKKKSLEYYLNRKTIGWRQARAGPGFVVRLGKVAPDENKFYENSQDDSRIYRRPRCRPNDCHRVCC
jgi:hypothetical protein